MRAKCKSTKRSMFHALCCLHGQQPLIVLATLNWWALSFFRDEIMFYRLPWLLSRGVVSVFKIHVFLVAYFFLLFWHLCVSSHPARVVAGAGWVCSSRVVSSRRLRPCPCTAVSNLSAVALHLGPESTLCPISGGVQKPCRGLHIPVSRLRGGGVSWTCWELQLQ